MAIGRLRTSSTSLLPLWLTLPERIQNGTDSLLLQATHLSVPYKPYWVLREEDMESYLLSPASGSVFIECFHRDGTEQTKELVWDSKSHGFRLV